MQQRFTRTALVGVVITAVVAVSCTPPRDGGATAAFTTKWSSAHALLVAKLADPAFVATLGTTAEQRAQIVADLRRLVDDPAYQDDVLLSPDQLVDVAQRATAHDQTVQATGAAKATSAQQRKAARDAAALAAKGPLATATPPTKAQLKAQGKVSLTPPHPNFAGGEQTEGWTEMVQALVDRKNDVDAKIAAGTTAGDPLAEAVKARQAALIPPAPGSPAPPPDGETGGLCDGRVGDRSAPASDTRGGTVYTPAQDTFAEHKPIVTSVYQGELQTRLKLGLNGTITPQFLVEAHVIDTASILDEVHAALVAMGLPANFLDPVLDDAPEWFKSHIMLMWTGQTDETSDDYWGPGTGFDHEILCYADDASKGPGEAVTRAYVRAWLPFTNSKHDLIEPGFQVRVATSDSYWIGSWAAWTYFFGSDLHTVHLGPEPLAYYDGANTSLGITADDSFIENKNSATDDDMEEALRSVIETGASAAVNGADGTSEYWVDSWVFPSWGWFGVTFSTVSAPTSVSADVSTTTTTRGSGTSTDDERLVNVDLDIRNVDITGYTSIPVAAVGLIPCFFSAQVDIDAVAKFGLDSDGGTLIPDFAQLDITNVDVDSFLVTPVPLGCNWLYLMNIESLLDALMPNIDLTEGEGEDPARTIAQAIHAATKIDNVSLPSGGGFNVWADSFERTCDPYGCDGKHAGDEALTSSGLEAIDAPLVTDLKVWSPSMFVTRRFPVSYQPSPSIAGPISDLIRNHSTPDGYAYDVAAWASPALLNQFLRSLTEGSWDFTRGIAASNGVLDIDDGTIHTYPQVAPVFVADPDYPLALFVPDLEFSYGSGYYATNLAAGIDIDFNTSTSALSPSSVSVSDLAAGVQLLVLDCESLLWSLCVTAPTYVPDLAAWLDANVIPDLIDNSVGKLEIPKLAGITFSGGQIDNVDGNLGIYVQAGTPTATVSKTSSSGDDYHFSTATSNMVGALTYNYNYVTYSHGSATAYIDTTFSSSSTASYDLASLDPNWRSNGVGIGVQVRSSTGQTATDTITCDSSGCS